MPTVAVRAHRAGARTFGGTRTYVALRDRDADPDHHGGRHRSRTRPISDGEGRLLFLASQTGLILPAFALRITSAFLLVIVVALFGGDAIAGEASWGNLRYMLMRPISRGRLVFVASSSSPIVLRVVRGRSRRGHRPGGRRRSFFGTRADRVSRSRCSWMTQSTGEILAPPRRRDGVRRVEPHRRRGVLVHGVVHDRRAVRRDLRRRRALLHFADPRRDRARSAASATSSPRTTSTSGSTWSSQGEWRSRPVAGRRCSARCTCCVFTLIGCGGSSARTS